MKNKSVVLVVDDDSITHDVIEGFLFREGYVLAFASGGAEALAMLDEVAPDIILLDVMMPDIDGFEVCQRLKSSEQWRHVPIILVTALGSKTDLARGFEAGADDFLHKPVNDIELRARVRAMLRIKRQYDELQATLRLREDLAHMIVHDMRSPLSTILGYSELVLLRGEGPAHCLEDVEKIHAQAVSLNSFLNDMLIVAKMESNQLILNRSAVNVSHLIRQLQQGYSVVARLKKIHLALDLPPCPEEPYLDANLFQRVVDNLLSNALKFSPPETTVTVQAEYPRQESSASGTPQLRLRVMDEGPGIPERYRSRIFDKFEIVALSQKNDAVHQVGLGLAFCKMVVEAHGGRIFATANEPTGTIFTVEI